MQPSILKQLFFFSHSLDLRSQPYPTLPYPTVALVLAHPSPSPEPKPSPYPTPATPNITHLFDFDASSYPTLANPHITHLFDFDGFHRRRVRPFLGLAQIKKRHGAVAATVVAVTLATTEGLCLGCRERKKIVAPHHICSWRTGRWVDGLVGSVGWWGSWGGGWVGDYVMCSDAVCDRVCAEQFVLNSLS